MSKQKNCKVDQIKKLANETGSQKDFVRKLIDQGLIISHAEGRRHWYKLKRNDELEVID